MDSILISISKLLGMEADYTYFNPDVMIGINSAIMALTQLGVGPSGGFRITGVDEKWTDLIGDRIDIEGVKDYVYLKTKLVFDPPSNSFLIEAINKQIDELEWRINSIVDTPDIIIPTTTEGGSTGV